MTQPPAPNPILAVWTTPFEAPPFAQIAPEAFRDAFEEALAAHVADPAPSVLVARAALEPPPTTSPRWYRKRTA